VTHFRRSLIATGVISIVLAVTACGALTSPKPSGASAPKPSASAYDSGTREAWTPERITLVPDDGFATYVGIAQDDKQFFVTIPFTNATRTAPLQQYVALYLWSQDGDFINASVQRVGKGGVPKRAAVEAAEKELVSRMGLYKLKPIRVAPFGVRAFGTSFGLMPQLTDPAYGDKQPTHVVAEPGDYMVFAPRFDSGEYTTPF
jgi:hypothetical protein